MTKNSYKLTLKTPNSGSGILFFNEKIDFSKYSKLIITYSYSAGDASTGRYLYIGSSDTYPSNDEIFRNTFVTQKINYSGRGEYTQEIDLNTYSFSMVFVPNSKSIALSNNCWL